MITVEASMENIKLIAADMDHTLLTEEGTLPPGLDERVAKLGDLGITFAIASGRPIYTLHDMLPSLAPSAMFICDNGGRVGYQGKTIIEHDLPVQTYRSLAEDCRSLEAVSMICTDDACLIEERGRRYDAFFGRFYTHRDYVPDITALDVPSDKFTIYFPHNDAVAQYEKTFGPRYGSELAVVASDTMWIDFMMPQVNKGAALTEIGSQLGIDVADMMAFGDAFNDKEMLATVGWGYRMANALPGMEAYASRVAPSNQEFGVLQVIDAVIKAKLGSASKQ